MFVDEPGMQFLFSALEGYGDIKAKADLDQFFAMLDRPRGIHLCGNPDREKRSKRPSSAFAKLRGACGSVSPSRNEDASAPSGSQAACGAAPVYLQQGACP